MSNIFMVLGRYALLVDEMVERAEKAEDERDMWREKWYAQFGDTMEARSEAQHWYRKYNMLIADTRIGPADQSWVMPDAVGDMQECACAMCTSQDIQGDDLAGTLDKKNSVDNSL